MCTRQPRKVIWHMINTLFLMTVAVEPDFCCFPLALANICPWPLVPLFQISLENRAEKTTHNTFRDCRVHFIRQPFSKQLYTHFSSCHPLNCKKSFIKGKALRLLRTNSVRENFEKRRGYPLTLVQEILTGVKFAGRKEDLRNKTKPTN